MTKITDTNPSRWSTELHSDGDMGGTGSAPPTGTVSFLDATNGNALLGTATLGADSTGHRLLRHPSKMLTASLYLSVWNSFNP